MGRGRGGHRCRGEVGQDLRVEAELGEAHRTEGHNGVMLTSGGGRTRRGLDGTTAASAAVAAHVNILVIVAAWWWRVATAVPTTAGASSRPVARRVRRRLGFGANAAPRKS